ncbi:membrane protein [Shewanella sp. NFH-SH190041]|uniref:RodZ domain-containing protein n=1 Tax=Shewanella sp. NFH-SH190041 TaxID=2950245 RepID=UPI0021C46D35|nr:RodZ domain-containing protein [Shewanella sp. NFH-SH190041]BDM65167.1 membrane protein [Shewanella sp. NFH-SH190041]
MTEDQKELLKDETVTEPTKELTATLGAILREARQASGMTIDDIASRLHLRPSLVENIEADKFDNMPSATYARGYVRSFARIVGADEALVMACLEHQVPSETEPAMQSFSRKTAKKAGDNRLTLVTWVIALVSVALLVLWWMQKTSDSTELDLSRPSVEEVAAAEEMGGEAAGIPVADTSAQQTPVDLQQGDMDPAQDESLTLPAKPEPQATPTSAPQQSATIPASPAVTHDTTTVTPASADDIPPLPAEVTDTAKLSLNLSGDCWMKVEDATGKVLIHGVKKATHPLNVTGVPPFNLVIGAPQVVTLKYNGENISLADYPAGKVARFTLPRG